jgi:hypothetical protein
MNRKDHQKTRVRIHITVGFMLTALGLVFGALTVQINGAEPAKRLVIANVGPYETALSGILVPNATGPVSVDITDSILSGYGAHFDLRPGDAAFADSPLFEHVGIFLVPAPTVDGLEVESLISYDDGTSRNSFSLGPIGAVTAEHSSIGPFISDAKRGTWITTFPAKSTPVWLIVHDGLHLFAPAWETYTALPPVHQYQLATTNPSSMLFVEVRIGDPWFGCLPFQDCSTFSPLYGFGSSGRPAGGNFKAFPFGN